MKFFADSYALVEYFKDHPRYVQLIDENEIMTTLLNLMEMYYAALLEYGVERAEEYFSSTKHLMVDFSEQDVKEACSFRFAQRGKNISYVDALGYMIAKNKKAKFLTGDGAFKGMENVEWVK
jgi:predicted nucleic acid-binding protein